MEITATFPWWIGVIAALVSYLGLHYVAGIQISKPTDLQGLSHSVGKQLGIALATIGQYVFPAIFLIGAVASIFARRKRTSLYKLTTTDDRLAQMSWQDFELLVGEFFRRRGFSVKEVGGGGADGGVDLLISSGKDRYVVQCKKWKAQQVGVATVRELYGVMTAVGAVGGFVVTSGTFTRDAKRFSEGREIELVAAEELLAHVGKDQLSDRVSNHVGVEEDNPACPECGAAMVIRTARQGAQAGHSFWGCSTFPACRGRRQIAAI
jgi:restriction system protein